MRSVLKPISNPLGIPLGNHEPRREIGDGLVGLCEIVVGLEEQTTLVQRVEAVLELGV